MDKKEMEKRMEEIRKSRMESKSEKYEYEKGEPIKIIDGEFKNFSGVVND